MKAIRYIIFIPIIFLIIATVYTLLPMALFGLMGLSKMWLIILLIFFGGLLIAQLINFSDSSHLISIDLEFKITKTKFLYIYLSLSIKLNELHKHGPAVSVIPVFKPVNPFLDRSLFVFSHSKTSLLPLSKLILH